MKFFYKYYFLPALLFIIFIHNSFAQSGYGQPVFKQDFGTGVLDPSLSGNKIPAAKTSYTFSNTVCPPAGSYSILRSFLPLQNCFPNPSIGLTHDNNPSVDYGMMMIVNNNTSAGNRLVYADTVTKQLCPGALYRYSAAVINGNLIDGVLLCSGGPDYPVFELRLEDQSGNLIKKDTTAPLVSYPAPPFFGYKFTEVGFDFVMPGGLSKLILKLTALHSTCICAKDFAVDDIQIRPLGPKVFVVFDNEPSTTINKSVCFQHNKIISMSGTMGAYYPNPELQWQQSTDTGNTWTDIAGATAAIYSTSFSVPDTFLFRLSGSDASTISNPGCRVVSNFIKVEVDGLPKNYTLSSNSPVCSGQDLKFKAEGAATYEWTGSNGFYDNIAQPHVFFSSLKDSGVYYVEVYSLGGCHVKDSIQVTIIGTDVHAGPDTAICKGRSVNLYTSKGINYTWIPAEGLSNTSVINPVAKPDKTTVYTVKVTDKDGCSDTAQVKIIVLNKNITKAEFSSNDFLCRAADSICFINQSIGDITTWQWNFGNGQVSDLQNPPVQQYQILGNTNNFIVQLVVRDTTGCADSAYKNLKVVDNCYIAVPNAFTPNNDGLNDYLYPLNAYKATNLLFTIYNRLGQRVFTTNDWTKKWDGGMGGMQQESGVYVWMLNYNDAEGKKISLKGTTVLIR